MQLSKQETADTLKRTMQTLPSPVVIITAAYGKQQRGTTVGSFTSLSLSPPLISFNIDRDSQMHVVLKKATHFGVHLPLPEHEELCNHFARPDQTAEQQFRSVPHLRNTYGTPILSPISSYLQCRAYDQLEAGDHTIFVGEVTEIKEREKQDKQAGIFYCNHEYRSIPLVANKLSIKQTG